MQHDTHHRRTTFHRRAALLAVVLALANVPRIGRAELAADDFIVVSGPAAPRVAYGIRRQPEGLLLVLDVAVLPGSEIAPEVDVGLAAVRTAIRTSREADVRSNGSAFRYAFSFPAGALVNTIADWARLRMGIAVAWKGGPRGMDRQRERFLHLGGAPHMGLSPAPADWMPLDLREYAALVADARLRIGFDLAQPIDGKATVVIEDAAGRRVRNLLSGAPLAKGTQRVDWDGLDEGGNVVAPGEYRWRAVSHPGIRPEHLFSYCNDGTPPWRTGTGTDMWGPDHSCLIAAAAGREWTFLAGPVAESGYAIVAVDQQGIKRMHYNPAPGTGLDMVALAVDDQFLYVAQDGFFWGQHVDRFRPDWKARAQLTLTRMEIASGRIVPFGKERFVVLRAMEIGPGSANPKWEGPSLGGLALRREKLYVSDKAAGRILEVDARTGQTLGQIARDAPGALAATDAGVYAVSGRQIVVL